MIPHQQDLSAGVTVQDLSAGVTVQSLGGTPEPLSPAAPATAPAQSPAPKPADGGRKTSKP